MHISKLNYSFPSQILCSDDHYSCTSSEEGFSRRRNLDYRVVVPPIHPDRIPFSGRLLDSKNRRLQIWMDHLIFHHLRNSSFLLPPKRYQPLQGSTIRSHFTSLVCPYCLALVIFLGGPQSIQVVRASDIEVEVESSFISESELSDQNSAQMFFVILTSLMISQVHLATNNNFYHFLHCRFSSLCHLHWDGP